MATRYWVGGTGTWDTSSTTNWSATSGGAGGASAPTAADAVVFDSASGTGTCTTAAGATCTTISFDTATVQLTLGANLTQSSGFTLTSGTLSLGSYTLSCSQFLTNNSNVRTINFGTGNITVTGNAATIWTSSTVTNLTILGTPVVNCTYSGSTGNRVITPGSGISEAYAISFNVTAGSDTFQISNSNAVKNLNFTGYSGSLVSTNITIYGNVTLSSTMTTADGSQTKTFAATSGTQLITSNGVTLGGLLNINAVGATVQLADSLTMLSTRTATLTNGALDLNSKTLSCGLFSSTNTNTRSIAWGTGKIVLPNNSATIFSVGNATGLSYTGTPKVECTYAGSTGTRTLLSALATSFYITAGSDTVTSSGTSTFQTLDFTGFTGTLGNATRNIYGDVILGSGMTMTDGASVQWFLSSSSTQTVTSNNVQFNSPVTVSAASSTIVFSDAFTQNSGRAFTFVQGTVKFKSGATSTVGSFVTSGSTQKYLQSTTAGSQATLSQASGTVNASYVTIKDIQATGGAIWNAYRSLNNIDAGNNTGWDFLSTPVTTTTLAMRLGFGL